MDRIELHDVEYGDCTVLVGRDQSILMVDCGSVSQYVRQSNVDIHTRFDAIFHRYAAAKARRFLLTHYHRDHMNGFLRQVQKDPNYFDLVYLPVIPGTPENSPVLELALFARHFAAPQSEFAQVNTACLSIFETLRKTVGSARIVTLRADDVFSFDNTRYTVLSPDSTAFSYDEALTDAAAHLNAALSPFSAAAAFLRLKSEYIAAYHVCQNAFSPASLTTEQQKETLLLRLADLWEKLEGCRGTLDHLPGTQAVREILSDPSLRTLYTETQNDLSLVIHNLRTRSGAFDILLPGDASAAVLDTLAPKLYDGYYVVKAPHHGTESHVGAALRNLSVSHFLISNGDYHAGGAVSEHYTARDSVKHCTNTAACAWFAENKSCCNRLLRCWEQPMSGALTLKCISAAGNRRTPCNIYVFGHSGVHGCHCDRTGV